MLSGGLDSTYLAYKELKDGNDITVGYVKMLNNTYKTEYEESARSRIIEMLREDFPDRSICDNGTVLEAHVRIADVSYMPQLMLLMSGCFHGSDMCDCVKMGYVNGDSSIKYIDDILEMWNCMMKVRVGVAPELSFPLSKVSKDEICNSLPDKYLDVVWTCENPNSDGTPCCSCGPCMRDPRMMVTVQNVRGIRAIPAIPLKQFTSELEIRELETKEHEETDNDTGLHSRIHAVRVDAEDIRKQ